SQSKSFAGRRTTGQPAQAPASTTNSRFDVVAARLGRSLRRPTTRPPPLRRRALSLPGRVNEQYKDEVDVRWRAANDLRIFVLAAGLAPVTIRDSERFEARRSPKTGFDPLWQS